MEDRQPVEYAANAVSNAAVTWAKAAAAKAHDTSAKKRRRAESTLREIDFDAEVKKLKAEVRRALSLGPGEAPKADE